MMKNHFVLLVCLTAFVCVNNTESGDLPMLISSSHEFVMSHEVYDDFGYYDDHENFIRKYFSVKYESKRIVATTLMNLNCLDSYVGKIDVSNDTIYLKKEMDDFLSGDRLCPEFHKFIFVISNPKDRKYTVMSMK